MKCKMPSAAEIRKRTGVAYPDPKIQTGYIEPLTKLAGRDLTPEQLSEEMLKLKEQFERKPANRGTIVNYSDLNLMIAVLFAHTEFVCKAISYINRAMHTARAA